MKNFLILIGLCLILFSCKKENSQNTVDTQEIELSKVASEGDAQSEQSYSQIFDDVMGTSDEVGVYGTGIFGREYGLDTAQRCFTVRVERPNAPQPFPVIVVITFPQSGCMGPDGRVRRGQIKTTYTNRLIVPGAESITTFLNYSIDSVTVGGTYKVKNMVEPIQITIFPPQYNHKWLINVVGGRLGYPNGNVVEWNSTKTIEQVEGSHTLPIQDNVFKIIGSSNGASIRNSVSTWWNSETIEPLFKRTTCRWIVKGKIRTVRRNLSNTSPWVGILDFGNGTCDNIAILNVNGNIRTITLP
jgi:hypothetical protein